MEWHVNCECGVRLKYANWSEYEHRTDLQNFKMQATGARKKMSNEQIIIVLPTQ